MEGLKKENIKKVTKNEDSVDVTFENKVQINIDTLKMRYNILNGQIDRLTQEREKILEIAKQSKIIL